MNNMSALFACSRCFSRHPFEELSAGQQLCKECRGAFPVVKCTYCRSEFQQTNKGSPSAICKKCEQNVKQFGKPTACEYCNIIAAFIGNKCQRCTNSEKRYGAPVTCEQCKQKCAFDRKDEDKKVDGKLLCWLCTLSFKRALAKTKQTDAERRAHNKITAQRAAKNKDHPNPKHKGHNKRPHRVDVTKISIPDGDKEGGPPAKIPRGAHGGRGDPHDINSSDHVVAMTQLKEQIASLTKQLSQKDAQLLTKDKMSAWIVINCAIFWRSYCFYKDMPQHVYLRIILGHGLCISRATASILNLSCCIVLLPVCRCLNSVLHTSLSHLSRSALDFWLSKVKVIHLTSAITIVVAAVIHSAAHVANAVNFSRHYDHEHKEINWAEYQGQGPAVMILTSVAGLTGIGMMVLLVLLGISSMRRVRVLHYRIFWAMHQLFLPFLVLWLVHPLSGILKELANYESHAPGCLLPGNTSSSVPGYNHTTKCEQPRFLHMDSQGWVWVCVPLTLYCLDVMYRVVRRNHGCARVMQVERVAGAVKLTLQKTGAAMRGQPGQYVLLQCPVISSIQWHPFTLVSCPTAQKPCFTILAKSSGDWTESLYGRVLVPMSDWCDGAELCRWPKTKPVTFLVDGPYWSPMQGVVHCGVAVCVAAGVGITPYMGAMQHLLDSDDPSGNPRRLHLVWVMRDYNQLLWSIQLICSLHLKFWNENQPDRFSFQIFITRGFDSSKVSKLLDSRQKLLLPRVTGGRPRWEEIFLDLRNIYKRRRVSVFSCGPKKLNEAIRKQCSTSNCQGSNFTFIHEAFS